MAAHSLRVQIVQVCNDGGTSCALLGPGDTSLATPNAFAYEDQVNAIYAQAEIQVVFDYVQWNNSAALEMSDAEIDLLFSGTFSPGAAPPAPIDGVQMFFVNNFGAGFSGTLPPNFGRNAGFAQLGIMNPVFTTRGRGLMANEGVAFESLSGTLAHEIGHALGLRHVADAEALGNANDPKTDTIRLPNPNLMWEAGAGPNFDSGLTLAANFDLTPAQVNAMVLNGTSTSFDPDGNGKGPLTPIVVVPNVTTINSTPVIQNEGNSGTTDFVFTVTRTVTTSPTVVNFAVSGSGTNPANDDDFDGTGLPSGTVTFTGTSPTATITIPVTGDATFEPNEGFTVTITGSGVGTTGNTATGTIINDDAAPTVTLSRNNAAIAEAAGTSIITATLSTASSLPVTIDLGFTGTATPTTDYTRTGTQIVIPAGQTTGTITVTAVQDTLGEIDETIIVDITSVTNGSEATPQQVTVTITDDDVVASGLDFGDAPATYPVTLAQNGARHTIGSLLLGTSVDPETDGTPSAAADADGADDGVTLIASLFRVNGAASRSSFRIVATQAAKLDGWIDFNADGDWNDAGEQVFTSVNVVAGVNILDFTVPASATVGDTFARFRLSTAGSLAPTGAAADGEVEDYLQTIVDGDSGAGVRITIVGGTIRLTLENNENVVRSGATELFRALAASIESLQVNGTATDDTITIDFASGFTIPAGGLQIDGGAGSNILVVEGTGDLDFIDPSSTTRNLGSIVLPSNQFNTITIDRDAINRLSPTSKSLRITSGPGDTIEVEDRANWRLAAPKVEGSTFVLTAQNQLGGGETIEVAGDRPFQNFLQVGDVNNSGTVTAGDALEVIFELNRRLVSNATGDLVLPATLAPWPGIYQDVNGDERVTAADALSVINILFLQSLAGGEGELLAQSATQPPTQPTLLSFDLKEQTRPADDVAGIPETLTQSKKPSVSTSSESFTVPHHIVIDDIMSDWDDEDASETPSAFTLAFHDNGDSLL